MTQRQLVQEFKSYPKTKKSAVIKRLLRIFEDDLEEAESTGNELSVKDWRLPRV